MKETKTFIAVLLVAGMLLSGSPAQAASFTATADRSTNLAVLGDTVTVTLSGLPADTGVYVRLCQGTLAEATTARPANCFGQGNWVSTSNVALSQGAGDATKPVVLAVKAQFTSGNSEIDCTLQACGINIRRDHMGGATDFSLDRFIPVTFEAAQVARSSASYKLGKVSFEIVGQNGKNVTFTFGNKKVIKKAMSDNFKVNFAVAGKAATLKVSVKSAGKVLISKKLSLAN